jgi:hypothetical protein
MRHRALAYAGVVLGVAALASFVEPMTLAQGSPVRTATVTVSCQAPGKLLVSDSYSGFPGAVRGVDFLVGSVGSTPDMMVKGGDGQFSQGFNQPTSGSAVDFGTVGADLLDQSGKVIDGSTALGNNGNPVTC